jgi:hypothetical protein
MAFKVLGKGQNREVPPVLFRPLEVLSGPEVEVTGEVWDLEEELWRWHLTPLSTAPYTASEPPANF